MPRIKGVKPNSRLEKILSKDSTPPKVLHPKLVASKKHALTKAISNLAPDNQDGATDILDRKELFSKLKKKKIEKDLSTDEYKQILKEKDNEIMTYALSNGESSTPRPDQKTLSRMIVLGSMGTANYSPASLFLHGGRIIFDCQKCSARMESIMLRGDSLSGQSSTGITPRKPFIKGNTISSHSLIIKDGVLKERKHSATMSVFRGTSSDDESTATLFQQHLGFYTGEQTGTQGSMILVTDKDQKNFMVGIEGSSYMEGNSEITKSGHSILGFVNKYSAVNQIKGSAIKKFEGFEDFPGNINEGNVILTEKNIADFNIIDEWLNSAKRTPSERIDVLNSLMEATNTQIRHDFIADLVQKISND